MRINDLTNNSSFTELNSDEANKVHGGLSYNPYLFGGMNPDTFSTSASRIGAMMAQTQANKSSFYRDFKASGFKSISSYALYRMNRRKK